MMNRPSRYNQCSTGNHCQKQGGEAEEGNHPSHRPAVAVRQPPLNEERQQQGERRQQHGK